MPPTEQVDVVVLGLGPGGEYAARKLAEAGLDVVGVDRGLVGGECPFWGCTPSKLMVRAADVLAEAHRVPDLAGRVEVTPDWSLVAARIREANHDWTDHHHVAVAHRLPAAHAAHPTTRAQGGYARSSQRSARTAARWPHMPCTPAPGGVAAEQRNTPGAPVA